MNPLLAALILASLPLDQARLALARIHTYDLEQFDVSATPVEEGLRVSCDLTLQAGGAGPVRLLLSSAVRDLAALRDGEAVEARLGAGEYEALLRAAAGVTPDAPTLLTLPGPAAPGRVTFRLEYLWAPQGEGMAYAQGGTVQTHLSGFWLPAMADEWFRARIRVRSGKAVLATGTDRGMQEGWRLFETEDPVQVLCLMVADLAPDRHPASGIELWSAPASSVDRAALVEEAGEVLRRLTEMFGPAAPSPLRIALEPRERPSPSYCAGSFLVLHPSAGRLDRPRRLALLAHECAHIWWGHRFATTVVGDGGTWLREGLAEWCGVRVAGVILGPETEEALWRAEVFDYMRTIDLRRAEREPAALFALETSLLDATYLDPPRIAYRRGALVHRALEHLAGRGAFLEGLRRLQRDRAFRLSNVGDFTAATGARDAVEFYVASTRLPDFALSDVAVAPGEATGVIRRLDGGWSPPLLPVRIETTEGYEVADVAMAGRQGNLRWRGHGLPVRIEVDPARIYLDPIRSDNVWPR